MNVTNRLSQSRRAAIAAGEARYWQLIEKAAADPSYQPEGAEFDEVAAILDQLGRTDEDIGTDVAALIEVRALLAQADVAGARQRLERAVDAADAASVRVQALRNEAARIASEAEAELNAAHAANDVAQEKRSAAVRAAALLRERGCPLPEARNPQDLPPTQPKWRPQPERAGFVLVRVKGPHGEVHRVGERARGKDGQELVDHWRAVGGFEDSGHDRFIGGSVFHWPLSKPWHACFEMIDPQTGRPLPEDQQPKPKPPPEVEAEPFVELPSDTRRERWDRFVDASAELANRNPLHEPTAEDQRLLDELIAAERDAQRNATVDELGQHVDDENVQHDNPPA